MANGSDAKIRAWVEVTERAATSKTLGRVASAELAEADLCAALTAELSNSGPTPPSGEALAGLSWDQIFYAAERLIWLLPAETRGATLQRFAMARAAFPAPKWQDPLAEAAAALGRALSRERSSAMEQAFLTATRSVEAADSRLHLLLESAPLLSDEAREAALSEALDAAFSFPDEVHVAQQIAAVVLRDPARLLAPALSRAAAAWPEDDTRATLLEQLAETLPAESLGPVLEEAGAITDEWSRVNILSALRARLSPEHLAAWQTLADGIEDEGLKDMLEPAPSDAEVPHAPLGSVVDSMHASGALARAARQEPLGAAIAAAVARFIDAAAQLFGEDPAKS